MLPVRFVGRCVQSRLPTGSSLALSSTRLTSTTSLLLLSSASSLSTLSTSFNIFNRQAAGSNYHKRPCHITPTTTHFQPQQAAVTTIASSNQTRHKSDSPAAQPSNTITPEGTSTTDTPRVVSEGQAPPSPPPATTTHQAIVFGLSLMGALFTVYKFNDERSENEKLRAQAEALAAKAEVAAVKNPARVKVIAIRDAINMLATHTEAMMEPEWHVPRSAAEDPIKEYLISLIYEYALVHGPRGCGKSQAVLAALVEEDGTLRKGVFKVKVKTEVTDLDSFICGQLSVDKNDLEAVLRGARKKLGGAMPTLIIELDNNTCSSEQIKLATTFAKDLTVDKKLCKVIIVLSDNAAVNTSLEGGDGRQLNLWVGDMTIDAATTLLKGRKFDPKEYGYGEVADDDGKTFEKLFAEIGTRALGLVAIANAMDKGREAGRKMATAEGTTVEENESREAKKKVANQIAKSKVAAADSLRYLLNFNAGGDVVKAENKKQAIKIIRQLLDVRVEEEKRAAAENREVDVKFVPSVLTTDTGLQPSTLSLFMRAIHFNCHPLIYYPPKNSYRFHSTIAENVARNDEEEELAAEEKKLAAEEKKLAAEEKKLAAEEKFAVRKRALEEEKLAEEEEKLADRKFAARKRALEEVKLAAEEKKNQR